MEQFFPFILLFGVIYLFMIRPQVKRQKLERKFQNEIAKGTQVVMTSGIHGKVMETNEEEGTVMIETKAGRIKFEKSAISMEMSKRYQKDTVTTKK
jgi:preprotein translocase subunit YajC